jgi:hypothetical protein
MTGPDTGLDTPLVPRGGSTTEGTDDGSTTDSP